MCSGGGDLLFEVGVEHVRRWINSYGGQWRNRLQLGSDSLARTSLYQPLNIPQTYFIEPALFARRSLEDVYNDGERIARYKFYDIGGQFDVGANLGQRRADQGRLFCHQTPRGRGHRHSAAAGS